MKSNLKESDDLQNDFYRENIFKIIYDILIENKIGFDLSIKIRIVLDTIKNLEKIIFNNSINKDNEFNIALNNNLNEIGNSLAIMDDGIAYIDDIIIVNENEKLNANQKLSRIFSIIEKWVKIHKYTSIIRELFKRPVEHRNKVFLSYAYDDKLYTVGLFFYFAQYNIFLYVDWMQNDKATNGVILKSVLSRELETSSQLLFLDTMSSQLQINGNWHVRQWCAWEIGVYYSPNDFYDKFYISIYGAKINKRLRNNMLFHDFKQLRKIELGFLI